MTIHKATIITIITRALTTTQNIDSWCQIVLDLLDLMFAELFYGFYKEHLKLRLQWIITITKQSPYTLMVILIIFVP